MNTDLTMPWLYLDNPSDDVGREEEDGYDTDHTSSYDSGGDAWYSHMTIEILHGPRFPGQEQEAFGFPQGEQWQKGSPTLTETALCPSPSLYKAHGTGSSCNKRKSSVEEQPEAINELCQVTRPFYELVTISRGISSASIAPLLEQDLAETAEETGPKPKKTKRASESEVDEYPRAVVRNPKRVLNDLESNQVLRPLSPTATITFREALVATAKPRVTCLSFPPFIVVHVNSAYMDFTGFGSNEVLGLPLHKRFGRQEDFPSSVTAMHDRLATITFKDQETTRCSVKVSLVGPETSTNARMDGAEAFDEDGNTPEDDAAVFVTHYCLQLEPLRSGQMSRGTDLRRALMTPDSTFSCVVLG